VEDEFRIVGSVRQIAQRAKGPFAERAAHGITDQPLDANDHVGVDIAAHDRCGGRGELVERIWHLSAPWSARRRSRRQWRPPRRWLGSPDGCAPAVLAFRRNCGWTSTPNAALVRPSRHW